MNGMIRNVLAVSLILFFVTTASYCENITVTELVDQIRHATDVQRQQITKHFKYQNISVSGTVKNVEPWDSFDQRTDAGSRYYKVTTQPQTTVDGTPYEILILYKNVDKVKSINAGQGITVDGALLKVIDQRLIFSVWVYGEELAEDEKQRFR